MARQKPDSPTHDDLDDLLTGGRRSASMGLLCEGCGEPLTGKKARWCSDACRMTRRREAQAARVSDYLTTIENAVAALRVELDGRS